MPEVQVSMPQVAREALPPPEEVKVPETSVMVLYPSPGNLHVFFHRSLLQMEQYDQHWGHNVYRGERAIITGANISKARNELVQFFLDETDFEWAFFIDTDMVFEPELLPRLLCSAEAAGAKVMGGLCVMLDDADGPMPTIYHLGDFNQGEITRVVFDYPENTLLQVAATGAACLLIHRSVLEGMRSVAPEDPYPWFSEKVVNGNWVSEDIVFCLQANALGYPVFVDCGTQVGHAKGSLVWWPRDIKRGRGFPLQRTTVVIPVKDKLNLTTDLIAQLRQQGGYDELVVVDNGSGTKTRNWLSSQQDLTVIDMPDAGIHEMWNAGANYAMEQSPQRRNNNIVFLNNDLRLGADFIRRLVTGLRSEPMLVAASGNYDGRVIDGPVQHVTDICAGRYDGTGGFGGFAFAVRGEWFLSGYRFPEECKWWYGDNDLVGMILRSQGHVGIVGAAKVEHLDGGGATAGDPGWEKFREQTELDRLAFEKRWKIQADPIVQMVAEGEVEPGWDPTAMAEGE